jgi:hypothetical protein
VNEDLFTSITLVESSGRTALRSDKLVSDTNDTTPWAGDGAIRDVNASDKHSESNDDYPLDDDIADDDNAKLLTDMSSAVHENHIPPSSVQGWDHESRSAAEYDPTLQYSSPPGHTQKVHANATDRESVPVTEKADASEDLLDEDVDWNALLVNANAIQRYSSVDSYHKKYVSTGINL